MLTALELENFKGIATRQRIEFAPLTLLFGANSAGKSTILQALIYLHEILERGTADVDRTELGGGVLELGGFSRLVHRHENQRKIVLRVEFATRGSLDPFGRDLDDFPFPDLEDELESVWLELTIAFRGAAGHLDDDGTVQPAAFRGPLVERAVIGANGHEVPLVWLEAGLSLREGEPLLARLNLRHPLLATDARSEIIEASGMIVVSGVDGEEERLQPVFALSRSRLSALPPYNEPLTVIFFGDDSPEKTKVALQLRTLLEMIVLGPMAQLARFLRGTIYIGPLRTVPPRGFLYERVGRMTSWADGLAAWDLLLADRTTLVERTNRCLRRLEAGCQIIVQQLFERGIEAEELSDGHVDKTVRRLLLDTGAGSFVLPSEVGAGVSQIVPVVVAALEGRAGLSLIEQPEIHVHPAVQVGLGDLFIDAATGEGGRRLQLVETHSEHVVLRLLRRIRETTAGELPEGAPAFNEAQLSVLHVESTPDGVRIRRLRVDEDGEFKDRWPKGFFDERAEELF